MSKKDELTPITDVESGVAFLKDRIEETGEGYNLKKADAVAFMTAAGVPEPAQKQTIAAESLLIRSLYKLTSNKLIEKIGEAKKSGVDVKNEPVIVVTKAATHSSKIRLIETSTKKGISPKTGEATQSFGRAKLITDQSRYITKEERQEVVDACKKACGFD